MDFESYQQVAISAAKKGARILQTRFGNISQVRKKAAEEIVTEADTESEKEIISVIRNNFPEHGILSEECGLKAGASDYKWIIDPLDGTVNFVHQVPICCISIALAFQDAIVLGIVFNPLNGEFFSAVKGQGAHLNGTRPNVPKPHSTLPTSCRIAPATSASVAPSRNSANRRAT